jgi:hypothetical protein
MSEEKVDYVLPGVINLTSDAPDVDKTLEYKLEDLRQFCAMHNRSLFAVAKTGEGLTWERWSYPSVSAGDPMIIRIRRLWRVLLRGGASFPNVPHLRSVLKTGRIVMSSECQKCDASRDGTSPAGRAVQAAEFEVRMVMVELERVKGLLIAETAKSYAAMTLARKAEDELQRRIGADYAKFFAERAAKEAETKGEDASPKCMFCDAPIRGDAGAHMRLAPTFIGETESGEPIQHHAKLYICSKCMPETKRSEVC